MLNLPDSSLSFESEAWNVLVYRNTAIAMAAFKIREAHWTIICDFFTRHPDLITGRLITSAGRDKYKQLWQDLAMELNSAGYGEKTVEKWQKSWTDYKSNFKKKAAEINRARNATGGGPPINVILTELEAKFLALLGDSFFKGHGTPERGWDTINMASTADVHVPSTSLKRPIDVITSPKQQLEVDHTYAGTENVTDTPRKKKEC